MKKIIALIFVILVIPQSFAFALDIDWSSVSNEEIMTAIDDARHELKTREIKDGGKLIIADDDYVTIALTGQYYIGAENMRIDKTIDPNNPVLHLEAIYINKINEDIQIIPKSIAVDGWDCEANNMDMITITAGKMKKADVSVRISGASYSTVDEVSEIEFSFYVTQGFDTRNPLSVTNPEVLILK